MSWFNKARVKTIPKTDEKSMLTALMNFFKPAEAADKIGELVKVYQFLRQHFAADQLKDGSSREAAIDACLEFLATLKSVPATAPTVSTPQA